MCFKLGKKSADDGGGEEKLHSCFSITSLEEKPDALLVFGDTRFEFSDRLPA